MTAREIKNPDLLIVVTPEMIEAGAVEVGAHAPGDSIEATAFAVFVAMTEAAGIRAIEGESPR